MVAVGGVIELVWISVGVADLETEFGILLTGDLEIGLLELDVDF